MIRTRKPVRLLEWGEGTNTTNQIWTVAGEGRIVKTDIKGGRGTLLVELSAPYAQKNTKDNSVKIAQQSEGMTAASQHWGEVAMGKVIAIENGGRAVRIDIPYATKIDNRKSVPAWEDV